MQISAEELIINFNAALTDETQKKVCFWNLAELGRLPCVKPHSDQGGLTSLCDVENILNVYSGYF